MLAWLAVLFETEGRAQRYLQVPLAPVLAGSGEQAQSGWTLLYLLIDIGISILSFFGIICINSGGH